MQHDDFAIQNEFLSLQLEQSRYQLRKISGQCLPGLGLQFHRWPSRKAMQRKPSHFGSYCHPGPLGIVPTLLASMGKNGA